MKPLAADEAYKVRRQMLLTEDDFRRLRSLAESWGCSMAAAVRRLIRER